mgnify:CR=1 FL=1
MTQDSKGIGCITTLAGCAGFWSPIGFDPGFTELLADWACVRLALRFVDM